MAVDSVAELLRVLAESQLLSPDELQRVQPRAEETTPGKLATRLAKDGLLTRWQAQMLLAGRTAFFLGKYKLLDELGRGGMGAVYKAEKPPLGRAVALKVMAAHLLKDPASVARFVREIHAASALEHPNVVAALDADHVGESHFLVMEYVEGESLQDVLHRETLLPTSTACEYIRQAALGLQHAHERGMAHRDIKPSNLLLTRSLDGQPLVKILDMGLARFTSEAHDDATLTQTGQVMGTPDYIAPEQAQRTRDADIRSDIFSLGCTLFRMLTGRLPYTGENTIEKLMARSLHEAPSVRGFREEVSPELDAVVARMLARSPARRYQTPAEVAVALSQFVEVGVGATRVASTSSAPAGQSEVRPLETGLNQFLKDLTPEGQQNTETVVGRSADETLTRAPRPARKIPSGLFRTSWGLAGLLVLTVLVLGGLGLWYQLGQTRLIVDWPEAERQKAALLVNGRAVSVPPRGAIRTIEGRSGKATVRLSREGYKDFVATADLQWGQTQTIRPAWEPTPETARTLLLTELTEALDALPDTTAESAEARRLAEQFRRAYPRFLGTAEQSDLLALGRRLPSPADRLSARDIPAEQQRLARGLSKAELPGQLVAIWGDGRWKCPGHVSSLGSLAVDPAGQYVSALSNDGLHVVWDKSGVPVLCFGHGYSQQAPTFNADGTLCAIATDAVEVWSLQEKKLLHSIPIPVTGDSTVRSIRFVPGTTRLAFLCSEPHVRLWDYGKNEAAGTLPLPKPGSIGTALDVTRDGQLLAAGTILGELRTWKLADGTMTDYPAMETTIVRAEFHPDGRRLACGDYQRLRIVQLDKPEQSVTFEPGRIGLNSISWSPDGGFLTTNSGYPQVGVINARNPSEVRSVAWRGRGNSAVRFLSNDSLVVMNSSNELCLMDWRGGKPVSEPGPSYVCGVMDPLGEWVALGTTLNEIEFQALSDGQVTKRIACRELPARLAVSSTRRLMAVTYHSQEGAIDVFDLQTGQLIQTLILANVQSVVFDPQGRTLIASYGGVIRAWDCRTWKPRFQKDLQPPASYSQLAVSRDGTRLVAACGRHPHDGEYFVLSMSGGDTLSRSTTTLLQTVTTADPAIALMGSSSALYRADLASGSPAEFIYVTAHGTGFTSLATAPEGHTVVTAASDGKLRLLPASRLDVSGEIDLGSRNLSAIQVLPVPDGRHVVLVMINGTVWVLRMT